jgi:tellurite resistance protein TehA-like permease
MPVVMVTQADVAAPLDARVLVRRAFGLAAGVTVLFAAIVGLKLGGKTAVLWIDDVGTLLSALLACVLCIGAARRHDGDLRQLWILLAAACGAWTVGELIWGTYDLILGEEVPAPSWADAAYLAAIPLAVAGLLSHPAMRDGAVRKVRAGLDGLVLATALLFLSWTLVLGPLWRSNDLNTLGDLVSLAYPFGDVVLVFFVVLIVRRISGRDRLVFWCLLAGLFAMALADTSYAYVSQVKGFKTGNVMDTGWVISYLAIALAAYFSRTVETPRVSRAEASEPTPAAFLAPFPPMLAALSVATIQLQLGHQLDRFALTTAFALVVLVLARQVLLLVELIGPRRERNVQMSSRLLSALSDAGPGSDPPKPATESPR